MSIRIVEGRAVRDEAAKALIGIYINYVCSICPINCKSECGSITTRRVFNGEFQPEATVDTKKVNIQEALCIT